MSYHNLSLMDDRAREPSARFDDWLQEALVGRSGEARAEQLAKWHRAPCARLVHPREDHLLPLMVAAGAAWDDPGACIFRDEHLFGSITASSFRFGAYQSATNREIPHVDVQANTLRP
jgi:aromatic ring-opening dioxygenase catalytic subunit (LigB family)